MGAMVITIALPESSDDIGRWLERNGGVISIGCAFGSYSVIVRWGVTHSYSDDAGQHRESWELSRHGKDLPATLAAALKAAMARSAR